MATVTIRNREYVVETAITAEEQERWLSGRDAIDSSGGMLFVLPRPEKATVQMKDVRFPLDVLWVDSRRKIVHSASLSAWNSSNYDEETPSEDAYFVLEIPVGEIVSGGFSIGDEVLIR